MMQHIWVCPHCGKSFEATNMDSHGQVKILKSGVYLDNCWYCGTPTDSSSKNYITGYEIEERGK